MTPKLTGQYALLGKAYDFPASTPARLCYAIISTPRCGSSLLAMRLWETGRLGAPLEYFNYQSWMLAMSGRLGAANLPEYLERLLAVRTGPNGVFGFKAHTDHVRFLMLANLWRGLGLSRLIRIVRTDRLAQAVSLVMAGQSRKYSSLDAPIRAPVYNAESIRAASAYLRQCETQWTQIAAQTDLPILTVDYDRLVADGGGVVREALAFIGPGEAPPVADLPEYRRQADATNEAWIARFKAENG